MINISVLVSGGGTNLQAIIDKIADETIKDARIVRVISNNAGAYAIERARKAGIAARVIAPADFESREDFYAALTDELDAAGTEIIVLAGFLVVLPEKLIKKYRNRIINIHPSLIPSFCGKGFYGIHVHEAALLRGVRVSGATVHFVDEGTDTGLIILQRAVCVRPDDTPQTLQKRIMEEAEWKILPEAISLIAQGRVQVKDGKVDII